MSPNQRQRRLLLRALTCAGGGMVVARIGAPFGGGIPGASTFDERCRAMVTVLVDMVLPRTETPGAIDAGVPAFVESMVGNLYTPLERRIFLAGLETLDASARARGGRSFVDATDAVKTAVLTQAEQASLAYFETHAPSYDPKTADENTPFFAKLKDLAVVGFFTSKVGAPGAMHGHTQVHERFDDAPCASRMSST